FNRSRAQGNQRIETWRLWPRLLRHPLWSGWSARPSYPASDGRAVKEEAAGGAAPHVPAAALVDVTSYSRSARTPSPRNRGRATLSPGGVCLDSVLQWWHRLLRVFPVCDSEPG